MQGSAHQQEVNFSSAIFAEIQGAISQVSLGLKFWGIFIHVLKKVLMAFASKKIFWPHLPFK